MKNEPPVSEEVVIKEYAKSTYWLEGKQVRAVGNLVLTNERLVFLKQVALSENQIENLQRLSQEGGTSEMIQFALRLHKKNFQLPLSSIVSAKMRPLSVLPLRTYMLISYRGASKNIKTLRFMFTLPLLKRLMLSEFPTMGWVSAIKKAVKAKKSITVKQ